MATSNMKRFTFITDGKWIFMRPNEFSFSHWCSTQPLYRVYVYSRYISSVINMDYQIKELHDGYFI